MLQFLEVYVSILKTVEMECPGSIIPRDTKYYGGLLINELHRQVCKTSVASFSSFKCPMCEILKEARCMRKPT